MKKKYFTEEERKEAEKMLNRERNRRYAKKHKEERKKYYQEHKEEIDEYRKKWREEHKEELAEKKKQYYREQKEKILDYNRQRYQKRKEKILEYQKQYKQTPMGRASHLLSSYKYKDKMHNRGECTLTAQWIIDNIFSQPCHYNCGESDWKKMGCDRIDNSKPHTPDNVVPCCEKCNTKRGTMDYYEFIKKLGDSPNP